MNHFTIWQWTDFARGLVDQSGRAAMEAHLARCAKCSRVVRLLSAVSTTARTEAASAPPDSAIRYAHALYSLHRPENVVGFRRLVGRLIHDSSLVPLPAGMRSEDRSTRHLLYEAGSFYLDLQVDQPTGSHLLSLVGQLSNRDNPDSGAANLPVWLINRKAVVASTLSNNLGEFQLECPRASGLKLRIPLPSFSQRLEVSISPLNEGLSPRRRR